MGNNRKDGTVGLNLTEGPILNRLLTFAVPMILAQLVQTLYTTVDLMVIGKFVGTTGTVGVSTGGECADIVLPVAVAITTGGQIYMAQLAGARDMERFRKCIGTMFTITAAFAAICTVIPIAMHTLILRMLNCPEEAFEQAAQYMIITCCGLPFVFGYNAINAILCSVGEAKRPLLFVSIAAGVNIAADLLLVVVLHMEAAGTAIATVLSQMGSFAAAFVYLNRKKEAFEIRFDRSFFCLDAQCLRIIIKLGVPQLIRSCCVSFTGLWMKAGINGYGLAVSATYSVGQKVNKLVYMFTQGIDSASGAMMGQNLGARKIDRVKKTMYTSLVCTFSLAVVASILFLTMPKPFYRIFSNDEAVIELGVRYLQVMSVGLFIHATGASFKAIISGAGAYKLSFTVGILDGLSRVAVSMLLEKVFGLGYESYYWGAATCFALPGIASMVYFFSGVWEKKKLLSEE